jgi:hypothetical protein
MITALQREREQQKRIKQQLKEQERQRFATPGKDYDLESVWVAHIWAPESVDPTIGEWIFVGFRRRRRYRRKPQTMNRFFSKVRRQLGIDKKSPTMLMDLNEATRRFKQSDQSWRTRPPQFQQRRKKMAQRTPALWTTHKFKQRAPVKAMKLHRKETRFIAIARHTWDRAPGYLYCGPLASTTRWEAVREAEKIHGPLYVNGLLVIATKDLSKSLCHAMHRGKKIRAGVSRIIWPEVPPTFSTMWEKARRKFAMSDDTDLGLMLRAWTEWIIQGRPWLTISWFRKQFKKLLPLTGDTAPCQSNRKHAAKIRAARIVTRKSTPKHGKTRRSKTNTRSRSTGRRAA